MNSKAGNVKKVKQLNRMAVLSAIKTNEPISRQELSKLTGLTPPAITGIVRELLEMGFVSEEGMGKSNGGRRPVKLEFNQAAGFVIGIEITRNETNIAVTDLKNCPSYFVNLDLAMENPELGVKELIKDINELINSPEMAQKNFMGVGVAFPGLVDWKEGVVKKSVNLGPLWDNFPLKEVLEKGLGLSVLVDNNANVSALGERWFGGGTYCSHLAYVNLGEGISAGLIQNDCIIRGFLGYAGEIGHMVIQEDGPLCNCGNRGCLESICGIPALVRKANAELGLLKEDDPLKQLWEQKKKVSINDILVCSQRKGSYSWDIIRQLGRTVGMGVANIINLYNPEVIFIGGRLAAAGDVLLEPIKETVVQRAFPAVARHTRIEISALGKETGSIGGCALAVRDLFKPSNGALLEEGQERVQ